MKILLATALALAAVTPILPASARSVDAQAGVALPVGISAPVERRSGRCPGGELRFFVPGCSGV